METLIEEFLDYLAIERNVADNTLAAYRTDLKHYQRYLRDSSIDSPHHIKSETVLGFLNYLKSLELADTSIARMFSAVRMFHRYILNENYVDSDPTETVSLSRRAQKLPIVLEVHEVEALLELPDTSQPLGLRDRALLEFMYATGCRISEALHVQQSDYFPKERFVRLFGKGRKQRYVPIGEEAAFWIEQYQKFGRPVLANPFVSQDVLFLNRRGKKLSRMGAWKILHRYFQQLNLDKHVTPHTLRHSFATHLIEGGADLRVVQELLGHADISTTQIYTHLDRQYLREVLLEFHPLARRQRKRA